MRRLARWARLYPLRLTLLGLVVLAAAIAFWWLLQGEPAPSPLAAQGIRQSRAAAAELARKEAKAGLAALAEDIAAERDPAELQRRLAGIRAELERASQGSDMAGRPETLAAMDALAAELQNPGGRVPEALTELVENLGRPPEAGNDGAR